MAYTKGNIESNIVWRGGVQVKQEKPVEGWSSSESQSCGEVECGEGEFK
jgi:hypothetical protein